MKLIKKEGNQAMAYENSNTEQKTSESYDVNQARILLPKLTEVEAKAKEIRNKSHGESYDRLQSSYISKMLSRSPGKVLSLKYRGLGPEGTKALAKALKGEPRIEVLNLEENGIGESGICYLTDVLKNNNYVTDLVLSRNFLKTQGAVALSEMLKENTRLQCLNISANQFSDADAFVLAEAIQENYFLERLDLSEGDICDVGAQVLAKALGKNSALLSVNLSWNCIRGRGAVAIGKAVKVNATLTDLNLSWNGLGLEGSLSLAEGLRVNKTLLRLNVEGNKFSAEHAVHIADGLKENRTLENLEIGNNPITIKGSLALLQAVNNPSSKLRHLGLDKVPINQKVAKLSESINRLRAFDIKHGGIFEAKDNITGLEEDREAPFRHLTRYLAERGIRVVDLFRTFENSSTGVSTENFVKGLKKVHVPLEEWEFGMVVNKLDRYGMGHISFKKLRAAVRSESRAMREEAHEKKQKRKDERRKNKQILDREEQLPPLSPAPSRTQTRTQSRMSCA